MQSRDIFNLTIKIAGFWIVLRGLNSLIESLMIFRGYVDPYRVDIRYWIGWGVIQIVFGTYLMVAKTPLLDLVFPEVPTAKPTESLEASPSHDNSECPTNRETNGP